MTILALSLLIFTLSVSAIEYDDFTKNGTNGEAPIFVFLGYAIDEVNSSICVEYNINRDALANDLFDKIKSERDWAGQTPRGPAFHREHGWYLEEFVKE